MSMLKLEQAGSRGLPPQMSDVNAKARLLALGTFAGQGCAFISYLFLARLLGPTKYGYWQILSLATPYLSLLTLGVVQGAHLNLPILRGGGVEEECRRIKAATISVGLASGAAALGVLAIAATVESHDPMLRVILFTLAFSSPFYAISWTYSFFFRGDGRFDLLSAYNLLSGALQLAYIPIALKFGLNGTLTAFVLVQAALALGVYLVYSINARPSLDFPIMRSLATKGLPIQLMGMADIVARTIDRYIVLGRLSVAELGIYAGAGMFVAPLSIIFASASSVLYTHQGESFGADPSGVSLRNATSTFMRAFTAKLAPIGAAIIIFLPEIIHYLIPKYQAGASAIQCLVIGLGFSFVTQLGTGVLILVNRISLLYMNLGILIVLNIVLGLSMASMGLFGISLAAAISFVVYGTLSLYQTCRFLHLDRQAVRKLWVDTAGVYTATMILAVPFVGKLAASSQLWTMLGLKGIAAIILLGIAFFLSTREKVLA